MRVRALLITSLFLSLFVQQPQSAIALGGFASAPLGVTATAIAGGVRVTWTTPIDVDSGITGFRVESSSSGNSGTWTLATTVASGIRTYDILGLSQVATYVRVAATTSAGTGTYGYPWTKLYRTLTKTRSGNNIVYETGFGVTAGDYAVVNSALSFSRIRYRMEDSFTVGNLNYADVDFYKWAASGAPAETTTSSTLAPTISNLQVLSPASGGMIQTNVADMNVISSIATTAEYPNPISNGSGKVGRLEIWPWNYAPSASGLTPSGDINNYDFDDTSAGTSGFGSFQVHDITASLSRRTVFAWNDHSNTNADIGFGSGVTPTVTTDMEDWTFCGGRGQCTQPTYFSLTIFINVPVTPLADATPPTVSRIDSRALGKNGDTITISSTEVGTAYLVNQSVTVTNLASITGAASANRNSVSVSAANTNTTLTLSSLNDGIYNLYAIDSGNNLSTAVLATIRVDNTLPTASSIVVNSSGTAILLTASETITNSLQVTGIYTISDSGSALSVSSTSFSVNIVTLNLSRAIPAGATVYFTYAPSTGAAGGRWIDQAGNEMAAISTRTITNNSAAAISVALTVPSTVAKGASITTSVLLSVAGRVTFTIAGKRIPGCINRIATGTTPITVTCVFKPALSGRQIIRATLVPTIGAYPVTIASEERFILRRTSTR
ncbi:MAG: hypothetical protein F2602_02090 [Actinobacteria bacterium]|uniref:Unannotated protein n=1 Tax=freshwater metagenome TaxID=449393 RepID=A0A6J6BLH9_9ZZZZ|nr:hypothetical protein [Actinomycetota bacterium]MTA21063.1 hypothetical protein [Actinomycetota bacterium]